MTIQMACDEDYYGIKLMDYNIIIIDFSISNTFICDHIHKAVDDSMGVCPSASSFRQRRAEESKHYDKTVTWQIPLTTCVPTASCRMTKGDKKCPALIEKFVNTNIAGQIIFCIRLRKLDTWNRNSNIVQTVFSSNDVYVTRFQCMLMALTLKTSWGVLN